MKNALATRRRLTRVRAIQLKVETLDLARARAQLDQLEQHKIAIDRLAVSSNPVAGAGAGLRLASAIELRDRLLTAAQSLAGRVGTERASVALQERRTITADRNKQMAQKLLDRTIRAADRAMERRRPVAARQRQDSEETAP